MAESDAELLRDIISNIGHKPVEGHPIQNIVNEDVKAFFAGTRSAEDTARIIQSDTILSERIGSTPNSAVYDVIGGVLTINTDTYDIVLAFDDETAEGTINFHYYNEGFSFESMSDMLIDGFDYPDDIPPSTADYGEVPVTFRVAKRG